MEKIPLGVFWYIIKDGLFLRSIDQERIVVEFTAYPLQLQIESTSFYEYNLLIVSRLERVLPLDIGKT